MQDPVSVWSMDAPPNNLQVLLLVSWCLRPQHTWKGYAASMSWQVRAILAAPGGPTQYWACGFHGMADQCKHFPLCFLYFLYHKTANLKFEDLKALKTCSIKANLNTSIPKENFNISVIIYFNRFMWSTCCKPPCGGCDYYNECIHVNP